MRLVSVVLCTAYTMLLAACASPNHPGDLDRTWSGGQILLGEGVAPTAVGRFEGSALTSPEVTTVLDQMPKDRPTPVVIYAHGCAGLRLADFKFMNMASDAGYAVFAPNSYARPNRKQDCTVGADKKWIIEMRKAEVDNALAMVKRMPWVDQSRIVLMGFSEGGVTAARYNGDGFAGRIVLGWTCHSRDFYYAGIGGPSSVPVLAVVGAADHYYQNSSNRGDCGSWLTGRPISKSVIVPKGGHDVSVHEVTRKEIVDFLEALKQ